MSIGVIAMAMFTSYNGVLGFEDVVVVEIATIVVLSFSLAIEAVVKGVVVEVDEEFGACVLIVVSMLVVVFALVVVSATVGFNVCFVVEEEVDSEVVVLWIVEEVVLGVDDEVVEIVVVGLVIVTVEVDGCDVVVEEELG